MVVIFVNPFVDVTTTRTFEVNPPSDTALLLESLTAVHVELFAVNVAGTTDDVAACVSAGTRATAKTKYNVTSTRTIGERINVEPTPGA